MVSAAGTAMLSLVYAATDLQLQRYPAFKGFHDNSTCNAVSRSVRSSWAPYKLDNTMASLEPSLQPSLSPAHIAQQQSHQTHTHTLHSIQVGWRRLCSCRPAPSVDLRKTPWPLAFASPPRSSVPQVLSSSCIHTPVAALATTTGSSLVHSCCTWQPSHLAWGQCRGLSMLKSILYR